MGNHSERYAEVAEILVRHGFGSLLAKLGLGQLHLGSGPWKPDDLSNPELLRRALEELGPTFIKLGQVLSTRPDILPPDYLSALSKLQSGAPEVPAEIITSLIEQELGGTTKELFKTFSATPLDGGSGLQPLRVLPLSSPQHFEPNSITCKRDATRNDLQEIVPTTPASIFPESSGPPPPPGY